MLQLQTIAENAAEKRRMATQDLLVQIEEAVAGGETDFQIEASGQHDIGGPLWNAEGKPLRFWVRNPGQRVGSMCLPGTSIVVDGPAPADVGWLNAGGHIVVRGDAGDTAGHCAAAGRIAIGGRAGTRTGSLMKHDPQYEAPELWVLKNVGSFSFEFMGGGRAVVCGLGCEELPSVLGERPCVGMVGGAVYFRGNVGALPQDVVVGELDADERAWLEQGLATFLEAIGETALGPELLQGKWRKITPLAQGAKKKTRPEMRRFRTESWVPGGIFSDVAPDDFTVSRLVERDAGRLRVPKWNNALHAAPCEFQCPASIPTQRRLNLLRAGRAGEAYRLVLDYTPFPGSVCGGVCPNPCMEACTRGKMDTAIAIGELGRYSAEISVPRPERQTGKSVGIIGSGVAGLTAAWTLARLGHAVTVYEADRVAGGKLEQVIPRGRLRHEIVQAELARIADMGVRTITDFPVDAARFAELREKHDALIVATGGHVSRIFPWPGKERIVGGVDFLKAVNRGENPRVPESVVVIGCGNAGMDAAAGAFAMGAKRVTCVDVQKPAAFQEEIAKVEAQGGKLLWPVQTKAITAEGLITEDGQLIPGQMVIITIGEKPDLSYLPEGAPMFRDWLAPGPDAQVLPGVFAAGDVIRPGILALAIGSGRNAALSADAWLAGKDYAPPARTQIAASRLHLAAFARCRKDALPDASGETARCVSCGTCRDCGLCATSCPEQAITRENVQDAQNTAEGFCYVSAPERCIGCGICAGVCPCGIWTMEPAA